MSKDDTSPGLFSKLVKFVRNPATSWTELDSVQTDKDDLLSRQLLKEMIERKRRNDFVRKREFDVLRKLRKLEVLSEVSQDREGRPSFFQSSMAPKPDDRATTLKKIDEIEAQMSMQWWKTKNHSVVSNSAATPLLQDGDVFKLGSAPENIPPLTDQAAVGAEWPEKRIAAGLASDRLPDDLFALPIQHNEKNKQDDADGGYDSSAPLFAGSAIVEPDMLVHDAELEETAILFANGDNAGAEAGLLEILGPGAIRSGHVYTWLTLFDLYRATGEQDKFENAAIDFIECFDRSPPQWFSLPEIMKTLVKTGDQATRGPVADWICPSVLGVQTVAALNAAMARTAMPWRLDWSNLKTIETSALEPLSRVFGSWAGEPVQLRFLGETQLQSVLLNATPSNKRDTDQRWWLLRMEMLRVIHRPDDFELTALEFCVTYEVSPPSWESARCQYKSIDAQGDIMISQTVIGEPSHEPVHSVHSTLNPLDSDFLPGIQGASANHFLAVELSGQIQGDAAAALDTLEDRLMGADMMQIGCAKLIRVDFSAAGTLLNWVSARHAENRSVQFCDVNRLVAAFFNVIGITEYADVVVRVD